MEKSKIAFRLVFTGIAFLASLVVSPEVSRPQSEKAIPLKEKFFARDRTLAEEQSALAPPSFFEGIPETLVTKEEKRIIPEAGVEKPFVEPTKVILEPQNKISLSASQPARESNTALVKEAKASAREEEKVKSQSPVAAREISTEIPWKKPLRSDRTPELITHDDLQGSINLLPYERIEGKGVRFRYTDIPQERIGHTWFVKPVDLRGKTVRVHYSGIVPQEMTFKISRSGASAQAVYRVSLEDSLKGKSVFLKVPDALPFKEVHFFEFEIERSRAGKDYGDFLIEKVEILEGGEPEKSTVKDKEPPRHFPFGSPFLQSNIWGGEVRSS